VSLSTITSTRQRPPARVLIYGGPKVGKSTWAAGSPAPIFIRTEDGLDSLDVPAFPLASTWTAVLDAVGSLCTEEHEFRTMVLDSMDWCEPLVWQAVCKAAGVDSIEKVGGGYGKGYTEAGTFWRQLLDGLDWLRTHKAMGVILIAHEATIKLEPPDGDAFDVAGLKLHKRAAALVTEWADVIGYAHSKRAIRKEDAGFGREHVRAIPLGGRVLTVGQHPAYLSGNRYGLPDELPLDYPAFDAALTAARR
jgi:hypothetical protein